MRKPIFISWKDLEKIKNSFSKRKKNKFKEFTDDNPDEEYLKGLPVVELNGTPCYIDPDRRERRLVCDPTKVVKF
jgi:hypothetical protein